MITIEQAVRSVLHRSRKDRTVVYYVSGTSIQSLSPDAFGIYEQLTEGKKHRGKPIYALASGKVVVRLRDVYSTKAEAAQALIDQRQAEIRRVVKMAQQ